MLNSFGLSRLTNANTGTYSLYYIGNRVLMTDKFEKFTTFQKKKPIKLAKKRQFSCRPCSPLPLREAAAQCVFVFREWIWGKLEATGRFAFFVFGKAVVF